MNTITIGYWHQPIKGIKYRHMQEMPYSNRRLMAIIKHVNDNNCSVMIRPTENGKMIWIDNGRFGQK